MRPKAAPLAGVLVLISLCLDMFGTPALAHEERRVGPYDFAVGFGNEPAYAGQENSVQLLLNRGGKPVTDLARSLNVTVGFSGRSKKLGALEPNFEIGEFGTPGDYRTFFFPTRPGKYTFHFVGRVGSEKVDERFTSAPSTFSSVVGPGRVQFPAQDPTNAELAHWLESDSPRIDAAIAAARGARDDAGSARLVGLAGVIIGAVGLAAAGLALRRRRA